MDPNLLKTAGFCLPFLFLAVTAKADTVYRYTNRLANEKSPYLLQHAHNPVDWYPWGTAAFEKSIKEGKPILLSIGYSTCHWCHVMERESFENTQIAELMNRDYVCIKVDREERPDIDSIYMQYVMAVTGGGGWPMTVFLTPDRKPFYGGTYFPPEDRYGISGFKTLLVSIADAWKNRQSEILQSADSAVGYLQNRKMNASTQNRLSQETLYVFFERLKANFDLEWGGFGRAPKFPRSHSLSMLLRYGHRSQEGEAVRMVRRTLDAMADGGLYDQIGGGFHRYSTDNQWRVPHFEKMLYDQALLATTYLEAFQATHEERYREIACQTLDYVLREMTSLDGGFFSAQDADSLERSDAAVKKEGAYFVWTKRQIQSLFKPREADIVDYFYGIEEKGNALSDPHHELDGKNVLYRARNAKLTAQHLNTDQQEVLGIIADANKVLFKARSSRPAPHCDDKILTDWNGLMISSLSLASRVLNEPRYQKAAERAAVFIQSKMKDENGTLLHRYRDGEAAIRANLNDYAFLIDGYLNLYEASFNEIWLKEAGALADSMVRDFQDENGGGFFLTASTAEALIVRPKELYDGAVPSGNSMAMLDLFRLNSYTGQSRFKDIAENALKYFSEEIASEPTAYPQMLIALSYAMGPSREIVLAGNPEDPMTQSMIQEIYLRFMPNKIIMLHKPGVQGEALEALAPWVKGLVALKGITTVYSCQNYTCSLPVTNVEGLTALLEKDKKI